MSQSQLALFPAPRQSDGAELPAPSVEAKAALGTEAIPGKALPRRRRRGNSNLQSPLRYPGGKRQLVPFFTDLLKLNGNSPLDLFIEPFAGGAAVSLHLLATGLVDHVILADLDPYLAHELAAASASMGTQEPTEGIAAFLEKRTPDFGGSHG